MKYELSIEGTDLSRNIDDLIIKSLAEDMFGALYIYNLKDHNPEADPDVLNFIVDNITELRAADVYACCTITRGPYIYDESSGRSMVDLEISEKQITDKINEAILNRGIS